MAATLMDLKIRMLMRLGEITNGTWSTNEIYFEGTPDEIEIDELKIYLNEAQVSVLRDVFTHQWIPFRRLNDRIPLIPNQTLYTLPREYIQMVKVYHKRGNRQPLLLEPAILSMYKQLNTDTRIAASITSQYLEFYEVSGQIGEIIAQGEVTWNDPQDQFTAEQVGLASVNVGDLVSNITDGSQGVVTNFGSGIITLGQGLHGGRSNRMQLGDEFIIQTREESRFAIEVWPPVSFQEPEIKLINISTPPVEIQTPDTPANTLFNSNMALLTKADIVRTLPPILRFFNESGVRNSINTTLLTAIKQNPSTIITLASSYSYNLETDTLTDFFNLIGDLGDNKDEDLRTFWVTNEFLDVLKSETETTKLIALINNEQSQQPTAPKSQNTYRLKFSPEHDAGAETLRIKFAKSVFDDVLTNYNEQDRLLIYIIERIEDTPHDNVDQTPSDAERVQTIEILGFQNAMIGWNELNITERRQSTNRGFVQLRRDKVYELYIVRADDIANILPLNFGVDTEVELLQQSNEYLDISFVKRAAPFIINESICELMDELHEALIEKAVLTALRKRTEYSVSPQMIEHYKTIIASTKMFLVNMNLEPTSYTIDDGLGGSRNLTPGYTDIYW